jgi:mannose-1-phosphate guanylyltransferase/mannose-6-phosphate isomerase
MSAIHPLILCGGVGTRLWPLSRAEQPKQFQPIDADSAITFFQQTVQRHRGDLFHDPIVSVSAGHLGTVRRQLRDVQRNARLIAEPVARNTGPAVLSAALLISRTDPDGLLLVCPSDHVINGDLNANVRLASVAANDGMIVTFGIRPRYNETGYGYIIDGGAMQKYRGIHHAERFVEKPNATMAQELIETGTAWWASGISLMRVSTVIEEYRRYDPVTYGAVNAALLDATDSEGALVLNETSFGMAESLPTERAVFEKTRSIALAPTEVDWDDVGAWAAFHTIGRKSSDGNVVSGDVMMVNSRGTYVRGGDRLVAVVGVENLVVVDTKDALLVTTRDQSQDVKKVVEQLKAQNRREAEDHAFGTTDWGRQGSLASGSGYNLRHLTVNPGSTLPIEAGSEFRRLMVVASGSGTLQVGSRQRELRAGATFEIGVAQTASVTNDGTGPMQVIEVACLVDGPMTHLTPLVELATVTEKAEGSREHA